MAGFVAIARACRAISPLQQQSAVNVLKRRRLDHALAFDLGQYEPAVIPAADTSWIVDDEALFEKSVRRVAKRNDHLPWPRPEVQS